MFGVSESTNEKESKEFTSENLKPSATVNNGGRNDYDIEITNVVEGAPSLNNDGDNNDGDGDDYEYENEEEQVKGRPFIDLFLNKLSGMCM